MIEINQLTKIYKTTTHEVLALDNVRLNVNKGEIFGIIGLSGAGKSTLIRCINMLEKPSQGLLLVDGQADLIWSTKVHNEPMGVYSDKIKDITKVAERGCQSWHSQ